MENLESVLTATVGEKFDTSQMGSVKAIYPAFRARPLAEGIARYEWSGDVSASSLIFDLLRVGAPLIVCSYYVNCDRGIYCDMKFGKTFAYVRRDAFLKWFRGQEDVVEKWKSLNPRETLVVPFSSSAKTEEEFFESTRAAVEVIFYAGLGPTCSHPNYVRVPDFSDSSVGIFVRVDALLGKLHASTKDFPSFPSALAF